MDSNFAVEPLKAYLHSDLFQVFPSSCFGGALGLVPNSLVKIDNFFEQGSSLFWVRFTNIFIITVPQKLP